MMSQPENLNETPELPGSQKTEKIMEEKEKLERAEKSLEAANENSGTVRNLYFTFLALGAYVGVIIASTTDEQLLRVSPVTLPLIGLPLPIKGFYILVPWLFLVFHFHLMIHLSMLARKLRVFEQLADDLPTVELATLLKDRLINFPFAQMLIGKQQDQFLARLLTMIVWITVMALPLFLLLWAQIAFLPYHSVSVTWFQRVAVLLDTIILAVFWTRIMLPQSNRTDPMNYSLRSIWNYISQLRRGRWKTTLKLFREVRTQIDSGIIVMIAAILCALFISLMLAKVPEKLSKAEDSIFDNRLDLQEKVLTAKEPSTKIVSILREQEGVLLEQDLRELLGINLQNRDLRYAQLQKSILPKADLRKAQLQNADLEGAKLQGANLKYAKLHDAILLNANLQSANFTNAYLQGAVLEGSQLKGAVMRAAQLQGVVLRGAQLQGQDFESAMLQGAIFSSAKLQGALLGSARLQGADLQNAHLQGADLGGAQLQGAILASAKLQGAYLGGAQLQGADLSGANLNGAYLRWASIGGTNFSGSHLELADLRNLDRTPLTKKNYEELIISLKNEVEDEELWNSIVRKIERALEKKDTLNDAKIDKVKCLSNEPDMLPNCRGEDLISEYRKDLVHYLIKELACSDPHVVRSLASRVVATYDTDLAKGMLESECMEVKNLPKSIRQQLEKIVEEDINQTDKR